MRQIGGGAAIFPSAPASIRNGDVEHEYRQNTDLYFLTGFEEPNSVAVMVPDHPEHRFVLFVQPKDPEREVWTGKRAGEDGARREYGADQAFSIDKLSEELHKLLVKADRIYYSFGVDAAFDQRIVGLMRWFQSERQRSGWGPCAVIDPAEILHTMRLVKAEEDLGLLRHAVDISARGHLAAMSALRPGIYEYELEAVLRYAFLKRGSRRTGYQPIVASGPNATVLHYISNDRRIEGGDLVLIDAGAEFGYYTGDISRTMPASGKFSDDQKLLYQLVLGAQLEAISMIRPGATFIDPHNRAVRVLTEGLVGLGLIDDTGDIDRAIEEEKYKQFYMHRTSHWLGMDVHDAGPYKVADEWRRLEPGMVMTVEPGLYISPDAEDVPLRYRGIGIRIEDDVLVTEQGFEVLSAAVPKSVKEIETIIQDTGRDQALEFETSGAR